MRRFTLFALLASLFAIAAAPLWSQTEVEREPVIRLVEFDGAITPISALRILNAIDAAEEQQEEMVLIVLDTPGGLVTSMESIVKKILSAEVPIVVWVGPSGAKAAS